MEFLKLEQGLIPTLGGLDEEETLQDLRDALNALLEAVESELEERGQDV